MGWAMDAAAVLYHHARVTSAWCDLWPCAGLGTLRSGPGGGLDQHPGLGKCRGERPEDVRCCLQPGAGGLLDQHPDLGKRRDWRPGDV